MIQHFLRRGTQITTKRNFYLWLNNIFNRVDDDRRQTVGADRVAAEWILRCGGGVKFTLMERYIWNYNSLPEWPRKKYQVEGIDAKNTYITDGGLDHLIDLQYLKFLNLNSCRYISDLNKILPVKETVEELNIHKCFEVKDLSPLFQLQNLKVLEMSRTTSIKDQDSTIQRLKEKLPDCVITTECE